MEKNQKMSEGESGVSAKGVSFVVAAAIAALLLGGAIYRYTAQRIVIPSPSEEERGVPAPVQVTQEGVVRASQAGLRTFYSPLYNITFTYPQAWEQKDPNAERYEGQDGFVVVEAVGSADDLDSVARAQAAHRLRPYGASPRVEAMRVAGKDARLILPSSDASPLYAGGRPAAVIVEYPSPVAINSALYRYVSLIADEDHIREIAASLGFLEI